MNRSLSILKLQQKMEAKTITAIHLSLQKTKEELLATPMDTSPSNLLDFTLLKLGNSTKIFQKKLKQAQVDSLKEISNKLNEKRNDPDITDAEI